MIVHKRVIVPEFWSDTDLIDALPLPGRMFYLGMIQAAEDSGCVEHNPMGFKIHLFPADNDIAVADISGYIEALINLGKIIPYEVSGKKFFFLKNFFKHQRLRSPSAPKDALLPPWIRWIPPAPSEPGKRPGPGRYELIVIDEYKEFLLHLEPYIQLTDTEGKPYANRTVTVRISNGDDTDTVGLPYENQIEREVEGEEEREGEAGTESLEPEVLPSKPPKKARLTPVPSSPQAELFEYFVVGWQRRYETEDRPPGGGQDFVHLARLVKNYGMEKCKALVDAYLAIDDDKFYEGHALNKLYSSATVTKLLAIVNGGGQNGTNKRGSGAVKSGLGSSGKYSPPASRDAFGFTGEVKNWGRSDPVPAVPESGT